MSTENHHWGTSLDEFLDEEGIREAATAEAVTRVLAWQLAHCNEKDKRAGHNTENKVEGVTTGRAP